MHKGASAALPVPTVTSSIAVRAGPVTASSKDAVTVYVRLKAPNGTIGPELGATIGAGKIDDGIVAVAATGTSAGPHYTLVVGRTASVTFTFASTRGEGFASTSDFVVSTDVGLTSVTNVVLVDKHTVTLKVAQFHLLRKIQRLVHCLFLRAKVA